MEFTAGKHCSFCESEELRLLYANQFHKVTKQHGPFDFYKCNACHSGVTWPSPSRESLQKFYASQASGLIPAIRENRDANPLTAWYNQCIKRGMKHMPNPISLQPGFSWADIGAGGGELAKMMIEKYPGSNGLAIDFNSRPAGLDTISNVAWQQVDLNEPDFSKIVPPKNFDLLFSITVLEHAREPAVFVTNVLRLLKKEGVLYLTVPDFGSIAAKVLRKKWPYYLPGEHLHIPSRRGLSLLLRKCLAQLGREQDYDIIVNRTILPYPLSYYCQYFGFRSLAKFFGRNSVAIRAPTGMLEASVVPKKYIKSEY